MVESIIVPFHVYTRRLAHCTCCLCLYTTCGTIGESMPRNRHLSNLPQARQRRKLYLSVGLVSLLWFLGDMASGDTSGLLGFAQETGRGISTFFSTISQGLASGAVPRSALVPAIGATLWTGLVTCAYTIYAQSFGQRRVSPTEANLIYTVQPIFTALFAWGLLGETLGPAGFVGAACIGLSVYTVAMMSSK